VANAGADQSVDVNTKVTLDGRGSYDPDNAPQALSYSWSQIGGASVTLTGATTSQPSFTPTAKGSNTFRLTVSDGAATSSDDVAVTVGDGGSYIALPGRIEAEAYKNGGEGTGYHDLTSGNTGGQYRNDNVDIENCTDAGAGYNVGWVDAGEWLAYDVSVAQGGTYNITARVASGNSGTKSIAVSLDGEPLGTMSFTTANGWQAWADAALNNVTLGSGTHVLRISTTTGGFNLNYLNVSTAIGGYVALQAVANNGYVSVQTNRALISSATSVGTNEKFTKVDLGSGKIALKSLANSSFVCADQNLTNTQLICDRPTAGGWETFTVTNNADGTISLLASNGKYVCAENGGSTALVANRPTIGGWETFRLISQ
jgi:hypothetical protein